MTDSRVASLAALLRPDGRLAQALGMALHYARTNPGSYIVSQAIQGALDELGELQRVARAVQYAPPSVAAWRCFDCATVYTDGGKCPECGSTGRNRVRVGAAQGLGEPGHHPELRREIAQRLRSVQHDAQVALDALEEIGRGAGHPEGET